MKKRLFKSSAMFALLLLLAWGVASSLAQTNAGLVAAYHFNEGAGTVLNDEMRFYDRSFAQQEIAANINAPVNQSSTDEENPAVTITQPEPGAGSNPAVSGTINVAAVATDNVEVAGVQFQIDGVNLGDEDVAPPYSINWNSETVSNGTHTITAVARDAAGNQAADNLIVEVVPDYTFEILDPIKTTSPNGTTYFELEVAYLNGFVTNTGLDLWVTGLPANVTANYAFDPMSHQGRTELIITTSDAAPGTYPLTVGATGEGITKSQDVTLIITNDVDFAVAASPSSQTISAGNSTAFAINVSETNDFVDPVSLSVPNLPTGFSATFTPFSLVPAGASNLIISTDPTTPAGQYSLTVQGQSGSLTRSTNVTMIVVEDSQNWSVATIGSTSVPNNTVRVGAIRTDSVNRIYVGTIDTGRVLEYSWNGSGWDGPIDVGGSTTNQEIHNMNLGDARGDGIDRLYAASYDGNIYEIWHDGTSWQQLTVHSLDGLGMHAAMGDGRNDGVTRLYSASTQTLYEHTWDGSGWVSQVVGATPGSHGVAVGNGRDDGTNSVFAASIQNGTYEARFDNGSWTLTHMGDSGDARDVEVGDGRNDGNNRVYVPLYDGRLREMTWNGSSWDILNVPSEGPSLIHAYIVPGRNDGVNRIYASSSNGESFEYTWNGTTYSPVAMGGGSDYMYGQHYGDVRGDGLIRIYAADRGQVNRVYEYTWGSGVPPPPTVTVVSPLSGSSYNGIVPIEISVSTSSTIASVQFRLNGANIGSELTTPPFVLNWDPSSAGGGFQQITAVVTDNFANQVVSDPFNLMTFGLETGDP